MASLTKIELTDDLDGSPADETVRFGLDGAAYEIDLSGGNANGLRGVFGDYVKAARKAGKLTKPGAAPKASTVTKQDQEESRAIRGWARRNGIKVADRGRVADIVRIAYQAQDPSLAPSATSQ